MAKKLSKLNDYILNGNFPHKHTGLTDEKCNEYYRKKHNITYKCGLCGALIKPTDRLSTMHNWIGAGPWVKEGWTINGRLEVSGFQCKKCGDEESHYFSIGYG